MKVISCRGSEKQTRKLFARVLACDAGDSGSVSGRDMFVRCSSRALRWPGRTSLSIVVTPTWFKHEELQLPNIGPSLSTAIRLKAVKKCFTYWPIHLSLPSCWWRWPWSWSRISIIFYFLQKKYWVSRVETQVISNIMLSLGLEAKSEQVIGNGIIDNCNYISQIPSQVSMTIQ
jgi:hypothetical protein